MAVPGQFGESIALDSPTLGAFRIAARDVPGARALGRWWCERTGYDIDAIAGALLLRLAHLEAEVERLSHRP